MIYSRETMRSLVRKFDNHGPVQPEDVKQLADFIALMFGRVDDLEDKNSQLERKIKNLERKK